MSIVVKVPKEIKIGAHTYKVWFDEREDDGNFKGSTLYRKREIILSTELHPQDLRVTFLHEAIHMLTKAYSQVLSEDDVSVLGEALGAFLFGVLDLDFDFSDIPVRKVEGRE